MGKRNGKSIPPVKAPQKDQRPVAHLPNVSITDRNPVFSFLYADRAYSGDWGFHQTPEDSHVVAELLCEMGRLKWSEILAQETGGKKRHRKHHDQEVGSLCKEARDRISHLHLDQVMSDDRVFRFRQGNKGRLWGFQDGVTFYVLWWDPDHLVYPTEP